MEEDISIWQKPGHFYFALTHIYQQSKPQRDQPGSDGSFFPPGESRFPGQVPISPAYQKLAFCPGLTSGHIPISPVSRELDFATRAGGKFIVSRAGEALRCTSEKSKSEIPVENPWR